MAAVPFSLRPFPVTPSCRVRPIRMRVAPRGPGSPPLLFEAWDTVSAQRTGHTAVGVTMWDIQHQRRLCEELATRAENLAATLIADLTDCRTATGALVNALAGSSRPERGAIVTANAAATRMIEDAATRLRAAAESLRHYETTI